MPAANTSLQFVELKYVSPCHASVWRHIYAKYENAKQYFQMHNRKHLSVSQQDKSLIYRTMHYVHNMVLQP